MNFNNWEKEIFDAYMKYFDSYTSRDWKNMTNCFSSDITMFGTGIDEISTSREETLGLFTREFKQAPTKMTYEIKEVSIKKVSENVAIIMISMHMNFPDYDYVYDCPNNRTTAVMVKEGNEWKLAHGHWSQPAEGQDVGESIPYKKLKERNRELEIRVLERTKEIEAQNEELNRLNDTKNKLFSIIAHDLRSPFNTLLGLTELMIRNFDKNISNPQYFKKRLSIMNERARDLYTITVNLLNWSRTQCDEINVNAGYCNITDLIKSQVMGLKEMWDKKNIRIIETNPEEIHFITDSEILSIIVRNLLSNAIKYSHNSDVIRIKVLICSTNMQITISDYGIGMTDDQINKVLSPELSIISTPGTDQERGTGLGLKLCIDLIKKLKGDILIKSEINKGSEFTVIVPEG